MHSEKKSLKSGAGGVKHALPRPRSCCRKGWLLGKVSSSAGTTGFDGWHFIPVCFYSLATKGALGSRLSSGETPLLMVPGHQPGAMDGELPSANRAGARVRADAVTSEQHIKPQNVSVNIVSRLGEQSVLLSERQRRV